MTYPGGKVGLVLQNGCFAAWLLSGYRASPRAVQRALAEFDDMGSPGYVKRIQAVLTEMKAVTGDRLLMDEELNFDAP